MPTRRPFTLFERSALGLSAFFLAAGFFLPGAAEALLRLYLPALALLFLLARVQEARLPRRTMHTLYSPFLNTRELGAPGEAPGVVRERARLLGALDDPERAPSEPVPASVRWLVTEAFARRLAERRGLHLSDPSHHGEIRSLLSDPAWALLRPAASEGPEDRPVRLVHLDSILDDLEEL